MSDRVPYGGNKNTSKLLYLNDSFTLPASGGRQSELEYDLAVGRISQEEFKAGKTRRQLDAEAKEVAAVSPSKRTAVVNHPRTR